MQIGLLPVCSLGTTSELLSAHHFTVTQHVISQCTFLVVGGTVELFEDHPKKSNNTGLKRGLVFSQEFILQICSTLESQQEKGLGFCTQGQAIKNIFTISIVKNPNRGDGQISGGKKLHTTLVRSTHWLMKGWFTVFVIFVFSVHLSPVKKAALLKMCKLLCPIFIEKKFCCNLLCVCMIVMIKHGRMICRDVLQESQDD